MVDVAMELHGRAEAAQRGLLVLRHRTRGGGGRQRRRAALKKPTSLCPVEIRARARPVRRLPSPVELAQNRLYQLNFDLQRKRYSSVEGQN